jgi:hypothetical protein
VDHTEKCNNSQFTYITFKNTSKSNILPATYLNCKLATLWYSIVAYN